MEYVVLLYSSYYITQYTLSFSKFGIYLVSICDTWHTFETKQVPYCLSLFRLFSELRQAMSDLLLDKVSCHELHSKIHQQRKWFLNSSLNSLS